MAFEIKEAVANCVEGLKPHRIEKLSMFSHIEPFFADVPNEIMCELAVDVVKACNDSFIYLGGYTNGCDGYLPTAEEYDKGGYEALHSYLIYYIYHGTVMPINRDTADKLVITVAEYWRKMK